MVNTNPMESLDSDHAIFFGPRPAAPGDSDRSHPGAPVPRLPIVFIGPMAAGKSTTARALAARLDLPLVPLDAIRWYYHLQDGFSFVEEAEEMDFPTKVKGWEPYSIRAVEKALAEFPEAIHDFGAGHAHYGDPERVERLVAALAPIEHVVLVLPHADLDRTAALCDARDRDRLGAEHHPSRDVMNRTFIHSPVFRRVATHAVFVEGRSVDAVVDELVGLLG